LREFGVAFDISKEEAERAGRKRESILETELA
jgi:hypothetical protein